MIALKKQSDIKSGHTEDYSQTRVLQAAQGIAFNRLYLSLKDIGVPVNLVRLTFLLY